jgi:hypothetical protein
MSAHLIIHDGSPWWASPDIWVVPGSDPNGPAGSPIAGRTNYLWARVTNAGNTAVTAARVDFYWANPSAAMVVGVATLVGSAYADLAAGDTQEVLCLVPWVPVIVNGGHECVVAVVHGYGDQAPLPDPLPTGYAFDPPQHDQIAQLNVSVLEASMIRLPLTVFVNAVGRRARQVQLSVETGGRLDPRVLANLGQLPLQTAPPQCLKVTLGREAACADEHARTTLRVEVQPGGAVPVFVHIDAAQLPRGHYELVSVVEREGERVVGGVSYLIVNTRGGHAGATSEESAS